jgi:hypothetical protein
MNLGESAPLKLLIRREGVVAADQDELRGATEISYVRVMAGQRPVIFNAGGYKLQTQACAGCWDAGCTGCLGPADGGRPLGGGNRNTVLEVRRGRERLVARRSRRPQASLDWEIDLLDYLAVLAGGDVDLSVMPAAALRVFDVIAWVEGKKEHGL